jgi:hypothetical protein
MGYISCFSHFSNWIRHCRSEKMMEMWDKLDEVIGAGMLTAVCVIAMILGYDSGVAQMCITGVVALLVAKTVKPGGENGPLGNRPRSGEG